MRRQCATVRENKRFKFMVSLIFKNLEGTHIKYLKSIAQKETKEISSKHKSKRRTASSSSSLYLLFRRCFSVASSFVNEKSPNHPFCCCLAMIGRKKGGGSFVFFVEKEKPKIKKINQKSLLFWASLSLLSRGQQTREEKKAISSRSQTAFLSPGPSVVEEDLEDLEDVHHRGDV